MRSGFTLRAYHGDGPGRYGIGVGRRQHSSLLASPEELQALQWAMGILRQHLVHAG